MTRRLVSTASMVDQVGTAIAKADGGRLRKRSCALPKVGIGGAEAADPTDRGDGRCSP